MLINFAWAQTSTGSISGTVTDPNAAVVPGAKVTALHTATGREYQTVTTDAGLYVFPSLPVGLYTLSVEQPGFKRLERSNIEVRVALRLTLDFQLEVGDVQQRIEVTAEAPLLEATSAIRGQNFSPKFMENLPLFTGGIRNPESFINYMPGVNVGAETSISGSGGRGKEVMIDGASLTIPESGGVVFNFPAAEMFGEFKLLTATYSAEYGRFGGGVELFITKSGTNELHGTAYLNMRRDIWNAAGWSSNQVPGRTPGFRAKERFNEVGGALGGPAYIPKAYDGRNRTFWFLTYTSDERPASLSYPANATIPTVLMKQGIFTEIPVAIFDPATTVGSGATATRQPFPGNTIPRARWSRVSTNVVPLIPDATQPGTTGNYAFVNRSVRDDYIWSLKLDHSFTSNNRLAFFLSRQDQQDDLVQQFPGPLGQGLKSSQRPFNYRWNHDYILSPTTMLNTIFGWSKTRQGWDNPNQKGWGSKIGLPVSGKADAFPRVDFTGADNFTPWAVRDGKVAQGRQYNTTYHLSQILTQTRGPHEFKLGWDFRRLQTTGDDWAGSNGQYFFARAQTADPARVATTGNAFASLLLGVADSATATATPVIGGNIRYGYHAVFFQDNWRITPRLTLELGGRYEVPIGWHDKFGNYSHVDLTVPNPKAGGLPGALLFAGKGAGRRGVKRFYPTDWSNIGPRFGFAYRLLDKTVLRGGFGIYYQTLGNGGCGCTIGFNASITCTSDGVNPALNWDGGVPKPPGFESPPLLDPAYANFQNVDHMTPTFGFAPRIYNWSFTIQQEFRNFVLEAAYVGNRGNGLNSTVEINQVRTSYLALGALLQRRITDPEVVARGFRKPFADFPDTQTLAQALRPYPQFLSVAGRNAGIGQTWYDSLQLKLERRFGNWQMMTAYTFSKSLALGHYRQIFSQWQVAAQDNYNFRDMKSYLHFDQPHVLNILNTYELPFGRGKKFLGSVSRLANLVVGGWSISSAQKYNNGSLIQVSAPNTLGSGVLFTRFKKANITGNPIRTGVARTSLDPNNPNIRWFNFGDRVPFTTPGQFELGNAATYYGDFRQPMVLSENFSIAKRLELTESVRLSYRADFFNLFNRTCFGGVVGTVGNPNFGRPTGVQAGPRIITMGVRLEF